MYFRLFKRNSETENNGYTIEKTVDYCKRGHFRVGVLFAFFRAFVFFAKITPTRK